MKKPWLADAAIGLALSLVVAAGYAAGGLLPFLETLELKTYDRRAKLRQTLDPGQEVVLVKIDDASISAIGRPYRWRLCRRISVGSLMGLAGALVVAEA